MNEAINAYNALTVTSEFRELERLRDLARHNEASALRHARQEAYHEAEAKWQAALADKDANYTKALADKDALIAKLQARLGKNAQGE